MVGPRPHRRAGLLFPLLPLAASLLAPPAAGTELPEDALRAVRILQQKDAPPIEDLVPIVVAHAPEIIEDLLVLLEQGTVPALADEDEQVLSRYQEALILSSFAAAGRDAVAESLRPYLADDPSPQRVSAALLAIGAVGESTDLRRMISMALEPGREEPAPVVAEALEKAVARVLQDDPRAFSHLSSLVQQAPPELLPALIRAVGRTSDGRGVEILAQTLLWHPELGSIALSQIRRLGPSPNPQVNAEVANLLRPKLDPSEAAFCRAAILVLGELEDFHSVPRLIQLLEESPGIRSNAVWALRRLSGERWEDSPQWWTHWYELELAWYRDQRQRTRRQLGNARQGKVGLALREYGEHRLFRHELAEEVRQVLSRPEGPLRAQACRTMGKLGSRYSVPVLVEALPDRDPAVRDAAWKALKAITGEDHPADALRWLELAARR